MAYWDEMQKYLDMGMDTSGARNTLFNDKMREVASQTLQEKIDCAHANRPYSQEDASFYHDGALIAVRPDGRAHERSHYGSYGQQVGRANGAK